MRCPSCNSLRVVSRRKKYLALGFLSASTGLFLIGIPFIGIPLILFGVGAFFVAFVLSGHACLDCQYEWK